MCIINSIDTNTHAGDEGQPSLYPLELVAVPGIDAADQGITTPGGLDEFFRVDFLIVGLDQSEVLLEKLFFQVLIQLIAFTPSEIDANPFLLHTLIL